MDASCKEERSIVFQFDKTSLFLFLYLYLIRLVDDTFYNQVRFDGVNFPPNGPVMQKQTVKWEPSTEKIYVRDGVLTGDITMALLLKGGAHYRCDFRTTYK